jgi:hypothetical protein
MGEDWPAPPAWLALDVTPRRVRRGQPVTIELNAPLPKLRLHDYELGLACLAHFAGVASTGEVADVGGQFRLDRQQLVWQDFRRIPGAVDEPPAPPPDGAPYVYEGADFTLDPLAIAIAPDAPYSYEGDLLSFYWAVWLRVRGRVLRPTAYVPLTVDP